MTQETRKRLEILFAIGILALLGVLLFLLLRPSGESEAPRTPEEIRQEESRSRPAAEILTEEELAAPILMPEVTARIFVERFGSYSSEGNFENVTSVLSLTTPELQGELRALANAAATEPEFGFYGISTQVLSIEKTAETETATSLNVLTQREETQGNQIQKRQQEILIDMVKAGDAWLVSSYAWQ
jgi:hypothetical protein